MLWHQSLKSIHYRILLTFQNKKKPNRFEGQNMVGDKRHVIPPCQNMGGYITPLPRIYALGSLHQHVSKLLINSTSIALPQATSRGLIVR